MLGARLGRRRAKVSIGVSAEIDAEFLEKGNTFSSKMSSLDIQTR
jgi:hypothetical protein